MRPIISLVVLATICLPQAGRAADIAAGKAIFDTTCHNCHSLSVGVNKVGPSLWHVVGRSSASVQGYEYSDAMKSLHGEWTPDALDAYLSNPRADVHGVNMAFKGLPGQRDRANVIAYLESQQ